MDDGDGCMGQMNEEKADEDTEEDERLVSEKRRTGWKTPSRGIRILRDNTEDRINTVIPGW